MSGKTEYKNKWLSQNCDRVNLVLKKGQKSAIQEIASSSGKSLNAFIVEAIEEKISREKAPAE